MEGRIRDRFPRLALTLPGRDGDFTVEFTIDTAFDGDLALPADTARRLRSHNDGRRSLLLADGSVVSTPFVEVDLEWDEEMRLTEVLVTDGNPLLGVELLDGYLLLAQMRRGGEVTVEPL